jgi:hypothetical protein
MVVLVTSPLHLFLAEATAGRGHGFLGFFKESVSAPDPRFRTE